MTRKCEICANPFNLRHLRSEIKITIRSDSVFPIPIGTV